ncbi:hypothetical protein RB195_008098 [Necator americanus]
MSYKVFTKIILTRISMMLDEVQPQEQAGFRQEFNCLDHIQTVSRVIEVCREHCLPFVLTFVDYEKAFGSVETNAILSALADQSGRVVREDIATIDVRLGYSFSTALSPYPLERVYDKAILYRRSCLRLHCNG